MSAGWHLPNWAKRSKGQVTVWVLVPHGVQADPWDIMYVSTLRILGIHIDYWWRWRKPHSTSPQMSIYSIGSEGSETMIEIRQIWWTPMVGLEPIQSYVSRLTPIQLSYTLKRTGDCLGSCTTWCSIRPLRYHICLYTENPWDSHRLLVKMEETSQYITANVYI